MDVATINQEGYMQLFNYNTLKITLQPEQRSLHVELLTDDTKLSSEMLYELETLTSWLSNHIEINSVVFTTNAPSSITGLNEQELLNIDNIKFQKRLRRIQKLVHSWFYLPQTIIYDLRKGAANIGIELSIAADIRIMHHKGTISFDHLREGFAPSCGGITFAGLIFPKALLRSWLMASAQLNSETLISNGYLYKQYTHQNYQTLLNELLTNINQQAPVQRIQAKRTFLQEILPQLESAMQHEQDFAQAGIITMDWQHCRQGHAFMGAKEFAEFIRYAHEQEKQSVNS